MERRCDLQKSLKTHNNPPHVALVDTHEENPDLSKCVVGKHNSAVTDFSDCCVFSLVYLKFNWIFRFICGVLMAGFCF